MVRIVAVTAQRPAPPRCSKQQPPREPVLEVARDAEAREHTAERGRLEQDEHELKRRVPVREVEPWDVLDA
jgi:hypothetical protein